MKKLYIALGLLLNIEALTMAMENNMEQKKQENFQSMKQESLKHLDAKINILQRARECINAANDRDVVKKCHEEKEVAMKKLQEENRQIEIKRIEEKQQKLDEKKRKLQEKEKEYQKGNK